MIGLFNIQKPKQNTNKKIFLIFEITGVLFVLMNIIGIHQIDAKVFTNQQYNIKFEYPDEWEQDVDGISEYNVKYGKNFIVRFIAKDADPAFLGKVTLIAYSNIPNIKYFEHIVRTELLVVEPNKRSLLTDMHIENDIIDTQKHNLPENGQPYVIIETSRYAAKNSDNLPMPGSEMPISYMIFEKNGIGYELSFSFPSVTMEDMVSIAKQIMQS